MIKNLNFEKNKFNKNFVFNSFWVSKIINISTKHNIKHKIENKYYKTFSQIKKTYKIPSLFFIYNTIRNQKLIFKIIKVRVAGRIYQVPNNLDYFNRYSTALKWLMISVLKIGTTNIGNRITKLIINENITKNNLTEKTRNEIYKIITSYRGYLHFRWRN